MPDDLPNLLRTVKDSRLLRVLLIGFLILLLQIPILMIVGLIGERTARKTEAVEEVTSKWGKQQSIVGPALVIPYVVRLTEENSKSGKSETRTDLRYATFLPAELQITGKAESEARYR